VVPAAEIAGSSPVEDARPGMRQSDGHAGEPVGPDRAGRGPTSAATAIFLKLFRKMEMPSRARWQAPAIFSTVKAASDAASMSRIPAPLWWETPAARLCHSPRITADRRRARSKRSEGNCDR
jgi:hypothetical protein